MGKSKTGVVSSEVRYDDGFLKVSFDKAVDPYGHEVGRAIVHHPGSAVVLPVNEKQEVLLEYHFRLPAGRSIWELPAGKIDEGETALQAAKRELREETGLRAGRWRKLVEFWASPGFLAEKMTMYLAEDLLQGPMERGHDERMKLRWFTRAEAERMVVTNKICDVKTLLGLRMWLEETRTSAPKRRRDGLPQSSVPR